MSVCVCVQVCGWLLGGMFWVCIRLCVCACVRVWAGSRQDRAVIVPRPVLPLGAARCDLAGPGSVKGAVCSWRVPTPPARHLATAEVC